jgi:DNA-directed RNA polymerase specialized sigma subunit
LKRKELEQYKSLQKEIISLEKSIHKLLDKDIEAVSGKVKASMKAFPFTEYRVSVLMEEPKAAGERDKQIAQYKEKVKKARSSLYAIEIFLDNIQDSRDRQIIRYRYILDHSTNETAEEFNYTKGRISQIIGEYVED